MTEDLLRLFPVLRKGLRDGMVNLPSGRWAITPAGFFLNLAWTVLEEGGCWGVFAIHPGRNLFFFQNCHVEVEETIWQASKTMTSHNFHVSTISTCRIAFCGED